MGFAELTEEDERQIIALVESLPDIDKRIVQITRYEDGGVCVMTGEVIGERMGMGDNISVEKVDGCWRVKHIGWWVS